MLSRIIKITFLLTFISNFSFSQDIISTKNGQEIKAKIFKIEQYKIKYISLENKSKHQSINIDELKSVAFDNGNTYFFDADMIINNGTLKESFIKKNSNKASGLKTFQASKSNQIFTVLSYLFNI